MTRSTRMPEGVPGMAAKGSPASWTCRYSKSGMNGRSDASISGGISSMEESRVGTSQSWAFWESTTGMTTGSFSASGRSFWHRSQMRVRYRRRRSGNHGSGELWCSKRM